MVHVIERFAPTAEAFLALEPEEIGAKFLFLLRNDPQAMGIQMGGFHAYNFELTLRDNPPFSGAQASEVSLAVREAMAWLQTQCLLVPGGEQSQWMVLSRRAKRLKDEGELKVLAVTRLLPKEALHPKAQEVWPEFIRGDYATAIFKAMRSVEIALRAASAAEASKTAVQVARIAFHPENGCLTDKEAEMGEREAMANLFAGALGSLKNPHSHRDVNLDDPAEAASVIMFASYLLRLIDAREFGL